MQPEVVGIGNGLQRDEARDTIDMPLNNVSAKTAVGLQGQLQIHLGALRNAREGSPGPGLGRKVGAERVRLDVERSQANSTDGDAVALLQLFRAVRSMNGDAVISAVLHDAVNGSNFFD